MTSDRAPILDVDAFDAAWPLWGVARSVPPTFAPDVRHRYGAHDPAGPVDEGHRYRVGACGSTLTVWTDKATGEPAGIICPDCGAGQVCGIGRDHPATRLTAHGLRCAAHR
jgi:hypothetical protein